MWVLGGWVRFITAAQPATDLPIKTKGGTRYKKKREGQAHLVKHARAHQTKPKRKEETDLPVHEFDLFDEV